MKNYIPVKGNLHLVRDKSTGAILNLNTGGLLAARKKKMDEKKEESEKEDLKNEVKQLKALVKDLIESKSL